MNKTAIKNFAVWARRKLISDITYKAGMLGITDSGIAEPLPISTKDLQFFDIGTKDYAEVSGNEISQRKALVDAIKRKEKSTKTYKEAFEYIVEEVAYTWFNRLIAIRFMEVNDYLPSGIRVLSSENPAKNEPDFVTTPFDTDLEFTPFEQDKVIQLKDENKLDELFRMLFIKQCNKLHDVLPELFEKIDDYTELLLTISFTDKDGVVYRLVHDIEEKDFNIAEEGQVEIIGWLYQYYNTEPKDTVFANLKKNIKISKENIPAATQLFTPDWIVRYMVENSLGRLWLEGHSNDSLKSEWKYYLEEAEQEPDVAKQLEEIRSEYKNITPEEIKIIDPCMGSGHILVYAFDVLMQIYESYGYTQRDAARNILINNIHGLDIDTRAYQLAYFAVMMKARQYNRRILAEGITPNLFAIKESNEISNDLIKFIANGDANIEKDLTTVCDELKDAKEYGSILNVTNINFEQLYNRIDEIKDSFYDDIFGQGYQVETNSVVLPLIKQAQTMAQKYDAVITNPPYMGISNATPKLNDYIKFNYPDSKTDFFAVFIERCYQMTKQNKYLAMITMHSWMFLSSFEKLREKMLRTNIVNMAHLGARAFEEISGDVVQTVAWVQQKINTYKYRGTYKRLVDYNSQQTKEDAFLNDANISYHALQENFSKITGTPIAYWVSDNMLNAYDNGKKLGTIAFPKTGMTTGDNNRFLRFWFEININKANFNASSATDAQNSKSKWFPYCKGGGYRRWYGYNEYLVNWFDNGYEIKNNVKDNGLKAASVRSEGMYFKPLITWSAVTSGTFSCRYCSGGALFDSGGSSISVPKNTNYLLALLNCKVGQYILDISNATINYQPGDIAGIPVLFSNVEEIEEIANNNIDISKKDWDSFETSWDFKEHPLVRLSNDLWDATTVGASMSYYYGGHPEVSCPLELCYMLWQGECNERFEQLKANEEELNRIFIDIYGLQDKLTPEVEDKDVTVRKADLQRDIKSLISYAVGCMFGRYSLYQDGIYYAGGDWKEKYEYAVAHAECNSEDIDNFDTRRFVPDADNCLPITDEEYFEDDIVGRFVKFIETVYGKDTLEDNLDFIAKALGNKGNTSREVIRNYFLNDFIKDHIKIYQKRPIYWLYDSGKQNGFKALVYMHRYNADTTGNMRVEYLHRMQRVYEKELERMQEIIDNSRDNKEISAATKRKEKLQKQLKETKEYDAKVAHLALSRIGIDLDDGVKVNYEKVQTASDGTKLDILAKL